MPLTLKSNATVDAACAVYIAENGLTNMRGGASVTVVGTMPSSTVNGHDALGASASAGSWLEMLIAGTVAASTPFSVLIVGQVNSADDHPGVFLKSDVYTGASPLIRAYTPVDKDIFAGSPYAGQVDVGTAALSTDTWASAGELTCIVGRSADNKMRGSLNGGSNITVSYTDGAVSGTTVSATEKLIFGGTQTGESAGFAVSMCAFFAGVSPEDLNAYIAGDPWGQMLASGDTTAPSLTSPVGTQTGSSTATIGATTDEGNGTMYSVVTVSGTAPSVAQIQAGQDNSGAAAAYASSQSITTTGAKTFSATGLAASTSYYAHIQHKDAAGNDSTVVTSAQFTTTSGSSGAVPKIIQQMGL